VEHLVRIINNDHNLSYEFKLLIGKKTLTYRVINSQKFINMNPKPTVFVVDDDAGIRDLLTLLIECEGLAVEAYDSAESFLNEYVTQNPCCLLTDIDLPGKSGLELMEGLGRNRLPVIAMSGSTDHLIAKRAMKLGAVDYFQKPFDGFKLTACIKQVIERETQKRLSYA
jgi:FixJ family two-component response regulator